MSPELSTIEGRPRWLIVLLTLLGAVVIGGAVFLADSADSVYGLLYVTDQIGVPASVAAQALVLKRFVLIASLPVFGLLSDLTGRRGWLIAGALLVALGAFIEGTAKGAPAYFVAELAMALGLAMVTPTLLAIALEACRRSRFLATAAGGVMLTTHLSFYVASLGLPKVTQSLGYRSCYWIVGGIVFLGAAAGGTLLVISGLMARRTASAEDAPHDPRGWLWILVALAFLVTVLPFNLLNATVNSTTYYFAHYVLDVDFRASGGFLFLYGIAFAATIAIAAPASDLLERLLEPWARPMLAVLGLALACAAVMLLRVSTSLALARPAMLALGIGAGVVTPSLIALLAANVRHRLWGTALGLYYATAEVAFALSGATVPWLLSRAGYVPNVQQSAGAIAGLRGILSLALALGVVALLFVLVAGVLHVLSRRAQRS